MSLRWVRALLAVMIIGVLTSLGAPAGAAPKLDVCALLPIADGSAVAETPLVENTTPLPGFAKQDKTFVGNCQWSSADSFHGDGTDPPIYLPALNVYKYSKAIWKRVTHAGDADGAKAKKIAVAGASKAAQMSGSCPLGYDSAAVKVGKQIAQVTVGRYNGPCGTFKAADFIAVVAGNL